MTEAYKAGAIAYATNMMFYAAGSFSQSMNWAPGSFGSVMAHAAVGCASAAASGGKCGQGALAAGFGEFATGNLPTAFNGVPAYEMAYVSAVGGTASVLGGGKFANGAATAAFGYMYNDLMHENTQKAGSMHERLVVRSNDGTLIEGVSFAPKGVYRLIDVLLKGTPGHVYYDNQDFSIGTVQSLRTTNTEDRLMVEYFGRLEGKTGTYVLFPKNCINFSSSEFNKMNAEILRAREEGRDPVFK
jgi:hypothetical protein